MLRERIGFIGAGQMARALASGFVEAGLVGGEQICAADPSEEAGEGFIAAVPGANRHSDNQAVSDEADVVFLAVKPQYMASVFDEVARTASARPLYVSIAAGITLAKLSAGLGTDRVVRVMPNTPCLIGRCAAGYCCGSGATEADTELVAKLLSAVGIAFPLEERLIDAVTGLSGSGPAFIYVIIEALSDGGVRMGLPRSIAAALAVQTVRGAAEMVQATGEHPAILKDQVASPGGTTIAGLQALEVGGLRAALVAAVEAATRRSIELGQS